MATPTKVLQTDETTQVKTINEPVWVRIGYDSGKKKIIVSPDPFWVEKGERVQWFCDLPHDPPKLHDDSCFEIIFTGETPFEIGKFHGHRCDSGRPKAAANKDKLYKYSVVAGDPRFGSIDPQGGVKP